MSSSEVYIVAVSGGVDSVVLLYKLVSRLNEANKSHISSLQSPIYIVAHFDHGIRPDSKVDAQLVRKLAEKYKLTFELGEGHLNSNVSESDAREARYTFLRSVMQKHGAQKIITAHHQDDLLETMIINIIRGTGPRGLAPMSGYDDLLRPLINKKKIELIEYAQAENLKWNEDSTNLNDKYLRNYIRLNIMPKLEPVRDRLLEINRNIENLYNEIDFRISGLLPKQNMMLRSQFVNLEYSVQKEIMRSWLVRSGIKNIDSKLINRLSIAAKTLPIGKKIDVDGSLWLYSQKQNVLLTSK